MLSELYGKAARLARWSVILQVAGCLIAVLLLSGCGKVINIPASDSTPPTVNLHAQAQAQTDTLTPQSAPVTRAVGPNESLYFVADGKDKNGGVKRLFLTGEVQVNCVSGELGQQKSAALGAEAADTNLPPGKAKTERVVDMTINIADWRQMCTGDFHFKSLSGWVKATAENFYGGQVSTAEYHFHNP
ncbi:MAG TPA: hypothetical protein VK619_12090 [Pyrinomonadaceae bacterium]|nr:hypothetical protein [Pyrinomonadaceae bacterium]